MLDVGTPVEPPGALPVQPACIVRRRDVDRPYVHGTSGGRRRALPVLVTLVIVDGLMETVATKIRIRMTAITIRNGSNGLDDREVSSGSSSDSEAGLGSGGKYPAHGRGAGMLGKKAASHH